MLYIVSLGKAKGIRVFPDSSKGRLIKICMRESGVVVRRTDAKDGFGGRES